MVFCKKCGTENEEANKFCGKCGFQSGDLEDKTSSKKGILFIIVIIVLVGFGYYYFTIDGAVIGILEKCPYECCNHGDYKQKSCSRNYECVSNSCVEMDSDNDGLSDIREGELGTNPQLYDTDGDTLSDSKELDMGTNPLNRNTDGDRYDDNEDSEPLVKNTAKINVEIISKEFNWDIVNIGMAAMGIGLINPDMVIANPSTVVKIENIGDDYTSYVRFDIIFEVQNEVVGKERVSLNRVSKFDGVTGNYNQKIIVRDIPELLLDLIKNSKANWEIRVENLEYEKFQY